MTDTSPSPTSKSPSPSQIIAAYFLLMAIPAGLFVLVGRILCGVITYHDLIGKSATSLFDQIFSLFFILIASLGFFLLPGYWKALRGEKKSPSFWKISLFYNLFWLAVVVSPNLPVKFGGRLLSVPVSFPLTQVPPIQFSSGLYHFRIPDISPYTSFSVPVDLYALILVGAILSYGCYRNTQTYAPSPN